MPIIIIAFLSGILTALAPCVLPIIPVVIGGSIGDNDRRKPYIVVISLFFAITIFTLLLKGSTLLISIPDIFWKLVSGVFIILFGLTLVFPVFWAKVSAKLYDRSQHALGGASKQKGIFGAILIGFALGPVFTSCSPVYLFILSTVLPTSFITGLIYIMAYALGLSLVLLLVGIFGQRLLMKFKWALDPNGWFKKGLGIFLILVGLIIISGFDRSLQQFVIDRHILDVTQLEQKLLN
jgi:cytochrome c-type biogenesis protein